MPDAVRPWLWGKRAEGDGQQGTTRSGTRMILGLRFSNALAPDAAAAVPPSWSFFLAECAQYMPSQTNFYFSKEKETACRFALTEPPPSRRQSLPSLLQVTVPRSARKRGSYPTTCSLSSLCRLAYSYSRSHASTTSRGQVRVSRLWLADALLRGTLESRYRTPKVLSSSSRS